jgi:hypothetical protein
MPGIGEKTRRKTSKTKTATATKTVVQSAPVPSSEAAALYEMNRDFLHLDARHLFIVACLNEYDETRFAKGMRNDWLRGKCDRLIDQRFLAQ